MGSCLCGKLFTVHTDHDALQSACSPEITLTSTVHGLKRAKMFS